MDTPEEARVEERSSRAGLSPSSPAAGSAL